MADLPDLDLCVEMSNETNGASTGGWTARMRVVLEPDDSFFAPLDRLEMATRRGISA
jgi:hypothetical protein